MLIERTRPSCLRITGIVLYPGMNSVPDTVANVMKDHPLFSEQVKLGFLVIHTVKAAEQIVPKKAVVANVPEHDSLADEILNIKTIKKAADIVSKTLSIGTLRIVVAKEKRKTVRDVAQKRLDEMMVVPVAATVTGAALK